MDTKKLRQKILDLAIRGKLVPQDPNDEPASVLLERIRAEKERLIAEGKIKRSRKSKTSSSESHYQNFEPPFEIPNSWEWCQVEDIFELNPKNSVSDTSLCGFIPMALVQDGFGFSHSYEGRVWRDVKKGYSHFQNGDIGIAKISPCFENRKSTIFYGLPNGIGAGTTELTILRPIVVDAEFYLFLFQSIWYITEGTKDFTGVVGQQRVNKEIFTSLVIPIPPIAEQKRITTEIKRYFHFVELIEYNKETLIRNTLTTRSKILELAMQGKLVPQDPADEPAAEMLKRINPNAKIITDNPHSWNVPNGWSIAKLKDIANLVTGSTPSKSNSEYYGNEYPFYKPQDLDKSIVSEASEYLSEMGFQASRNIPKNSIAICCIGTIGKVGFINRAGATNQQINTILPNPSFYPKFLYYYCKAKIFQDIILSLSAAITISIVNKGKMGEILILLPPLEEQKRIVAKIEELYSVLDKIEASLQS
ncbi:MAG: restriction endonuclease subunit S [Bacteroidales bacterium]|nr:restriction endonuclease subunit S [Bacteroidales bacterium]